MLGDSEHPISFKFEWDVQGEHAHVKVWAGHEGSGRGLCGELTMGEVEWKMLRELLRRNNGLVTTELEVPELGGWLDRRPCRFLPVLHSADVGASE